MRRLANWLLALCLLWVGDDTLAQEFFSGWTDNHCFVIHRSINGEYSPFQLCLPDLKEKPYKGSINSQTSQSSYIDLGKGRIIYQKYNDLFLIEADGSEKPITRDSLVEKNPTLSPDGQSLAYTKGHNLYALDLSSEKELQLTFDGSETVYNGWSSWVYYEEILRRSSHYKAFWWNPDSRSVAFLRFDDKDVPLYTITDPTGQHGEVDRIRYPKPGDPNPDVRLGVARLDGTPIVWMQEDEAKDQYTAWPCWMLDGKTLIYQVLNRAQDSLQVIAGDPLTGGYSLLWTEERSTWVEFHEGLHVVSSTELLFTSNFEDWNNLYRFDLTQGTLERITDFSWNITEIEHVDTLRKRVFFYGPGPDDQTGQHYFVLDLQTGTTRQLTTGSGWHQVDRAPGNEYFSDTHSSLTQVPQTTIIEVASGDPVYHIAGKTHDANEAAGIEIQSFTIEADSFSLPGYLVLPKSFDPEIAHPVVFTVYGGPNRQEVKNTYRDFSRDFFANQGIIQVKVDHRGSTHFGRIGQDFLHRSLGQWEINDLSTAATWLKTHPFVDSTRIGITGGSYGGYVACMALTYGADHFTHGIALYSVTDWMLYDNVYTERYMDLPEENPNGYMSGSALTHAHEYKGSLLLVHGTRDENVHMQHTLQLTDRFQELGKSFELMLYPGVRHGWGGAKRAHLTELSHSFWKRAFSLGKNNETQRY